MAVILVVAWLHARDRAAAYPAVRVAVAGLTLNAAGWLLVHFICAETERQWTAALLAPIKAPYNRMLLTLWAGLSNHTLPTIWNESSPLLTSGRV